MFEQLLKNNYLHIPKFICPDFAHDLAIKFKEDSERENLLGVGQAWNSGSCYNYTPALELLAYKTADMCDILETQVLPTYTYGRVYRKGSVLTKHTDRPACEISATINLLSDKQWPIFLDPTGEIGNKGVKVNLKQGDALFYFGAEHEHWREEYTGNYCSQLFIHYNTKKYKHLLYDTRPHLGLPAEFANKHEV